MTDINQIVLIDAYAQIYRCYFAIARLTNGQNEPVNALYGMARMLLNLEEVFPSHYGAVVFDAGKCTRRCSILPEYKAQRPPMPDDMRGQINKIREWISAFGWPIIEQQGLEADDLIAAITVNRHEHPVSILSKDKDLTQLVCQDVSLYSAGKNGNWLPLHFDEVKEKFGVAPEFVLDYLALIGDSADNIPGVDGIGPKTAAKLIDDFGHIENIVANSDKISSAKLREKIAASGELLKRNLDLVRLDTSLPDQWAGLDVSLKRMAPDWKKIRQLAEKENFNSFISIIDKKIQVPPPAQLTFDF